MSLEQVECETVSAESQPDAVPAHFRNEPAARPKRGLMAAAILTSVLSCLFSSPGYPVPWLAWVALVPVLMLLKNAGSVRQAAWIGSAFGLLWSLAVYRPLIGPLAHLAQWQVWIALIAVPLLLLVAAFPFVVAAIGTALFRRSGGTIWTLSAACIWTLLPLAYLPLGFYASQFENPIWLQGAAFGGTYAVQFLVVVVNCILAWGVLEWRRNHRVGAYLSVTFAVMIMIAAGVLGSWRLNSAPMVSGNNSHSVTVAWLQPGLPASGTRDSAAVSKHLASQMTATADWAGRHPEIALLVLPEISAGIDYQQDEALRDALAGIIRVTRKPLIAHSTVWTQPPEYRGAPRSLNLSLFFDGDGKMAANYAKRTLIPFAEYLPLETSFRWIRHMAPSAAPYAPGKLAVVFPVTPEIKAVPMLCYESLFSSRVRDQLRLGGNLLVEQANDASLGAGAGSAMHLAVAKMRSAEFGLPMVRVTATGVSAAFDSRGRVIPGSRMESGEKGSMLCKVVVPAEGSFYAKHGDLFAWSLTALLTALGVLELAKRYPRILFE